MTASSGQVRIRAAGPNDVGRIRDIARAAYAKYVDRIGREPAPMSADYAAEIAACEAIVVEFAGDVRGYLVGWAEQDAYFIDNIGVEPAFQGVGLGRALMEFITGRALQRGLRALRLYTNVMMTENLKMYARIGFVETHRVSENGFDRVYMRLPLVRDAA